MKYERVFKHDDFQITTFILTHGKAYYIHAEPNQYLHRDGTVHDYCGEENMHDTKEAAQGLIDDYYADINLLPDDLFEIEI